MQIYVYDRDMNPLGIIEAMTSLLWTRKFREPGEVDIEVPNMKFRRCETFGDAVEYVSGLLDE